MFSHCHKVYKIDKKGSKEKGICIIAAGETSTYLHFQERLHLSCCKEEIQEKNPFPQREMPQSAYFILKLENTMQQSEQGCLLCYRVQRNKPEQNCQLYHPKSTSKTGWSLKALRKSGLGYFQCNTSCIMLGATVWAVRRTW